MQEKSNENLNNFFRKKLNDFQAHSNGWNVTPAYLKEQVFQKIGEINSAKKSNQRKYALVAMFAFLTLSMAGLLIYLNSKVNQLELDKQYIVEEVNELKHELHQAIHPNPNGAPQLSNNAETNTKNDNFSSSNNPHEQRLLAQRATVNNANHSALPKQNASSTNIAQSNRNTNPTSNASQSLNQGLSKHQSIVLRAPIESNFENGNVVNNQEQENNINQHNDLPLANIVFAKIQSLQSLVSHDDLPKDILAYIPQPSVFTTTDKTNFIPTLSVGLFASQTFNSLGMKTSAPSNSFSLTEYNKWYNSSGVGIQGAYQLNKRFSVIGDVSYFGIHNTSHFSSAMTYDSSHEHPDGQGNTMYDAEVDVMTPLGVFNAELRFKTEPNAHQGENIQNETNISQDIKGIGLGLGARYGIAEIGKLNLGIGAGSHLHWILSSHNSLDIKLYMDNNMMAESKIDPSISKSLNSSYLSLYGELFAEYAISQSFGLGFSASYYQPINAISSASKTYCRSVKISTGIFYNF